MKIDISNKRVSNVIAGILIVFVAFVFIATALGVVGNHLYIQHNFVENSSDLSLSGEIGNTDFVPVDQDCFGGELETARGWIHNVQHEYCDGLNADNQGYDGHFIFPLCFDNPDPQVFADLFENYYKVFEVCGGYTPKACDSWFNIYQFKVRDDQIRSDTEYIGWKLVFDEITPDNVYLDEETKIYDDGVHNAIDLSGVIADDPCCCISYWVAFIDASCQNGACVESSQLPLTTPDCIINGPNPIPGKQLTIWLNMTWTGCGDESQDFDLILVQILRIPNSRINI